MARLPDGPTVRALVIGGGDCIWDDVARTEEAFGAFWWDVVIAANDIGAHWPHHLDAWASLHPNNFGRWTALRAELGNPDGCETWSRKGKMCPGVDHEIHYRFSGGASGLLAVTVALDHYKADRVVCCGVPMTRTPHFAESTVHDPKRAWPAPNSHWRRWRAHAHTLVRSVRSMSGRTRTLLGAPTAEWLGIHDLQEAA